MLPMSQTLSHHAEDFIDDARLENLASQANLIDIGRFRAVIAKALDKQALSVDEAAVLLRARDPQLREEVFTAARELKQRVYGNRIVLFAPLYVGNLCVNDCAYCGFQRKNKDVVRRTLGMDEIRQQVVAMEEQGHKRLIVVFGEHPRYDADFIATCIRDIYDVKSGHGEIRRVNVNAAPLDHAGFRTVKTAGIGTYQIFMETYHHKTYARVHPQGTPKGDYLWRLDALSRAFEVGQDDLGIGALFGLSDWRFDVLGLVSHAVFLKERYGCGPHTISFPRLRPGLGHGHRQREPGQRRGLQVPHRGLAPGGSVHRAHPHGTRDGRAAAGAPWNLACRKSMPARASSSAATPSRPAASAWSASNSRSATCVRSTRSFAS